MNTQRKGNGREVRTAHCLENDGWLVGSRRHIAGAGDLLAIRLGDAPRLIEVKATTAGGPYASFGPAARRALIKEAWAHGAIPELAYWPRGARQPVFYGMDDWPPTPPLSSPTLAAVA